MASKRSNGEGSVRYNAARGRWEARATIALEDGKPVRRMVTAATKKDVLTRLRTLADEAATGRSAARADFTVGRFLDEWLATLPSTVAPATEQSYRDAVRLYIKPHVGRKRLRTLAARDVAKMLRDLEAEGRAPNTRRTARSVLRRALRYAEAEGLVARNVAAIADGVRIGGTEGRTLTPDQARTLLAAVKGKRYEAVFTVALALGLRRSELLGLTWDDIDLDGTPPRLTVRRGLKRLPALGLHLDDVKTRTSRRSVHLPRQVVAALKRHRKTQAAERLAAGAEWIDRPLGVDLVFRTPTGNAMDPDNFRNLCYRVSTEAGAEWEPDPKNPKRERMVEGTGLGRWSPHELRHSAASLLLAQGVPLKVISETLGHSSIRVTADIYGHLLDDARSEAATAMESALWGS